MGRFVKDIVNMIYCFQWISLIKQINTEYHLEYTIDEDYVRSESMGCAINWRDPIRIYYPSIYKLGSSEQTGILPKNYF